MDSFFRFGVSLSERPIQVDAIRRERPKILYNNRSGIHAITTDSEKVNYYYCSPIEMKCLG